MCRGENQVAFQFSDAIGAATLCSLFSRQNKKKISSVSPEITKKSPNETVVAVGAEISLVCESSAYPLANTSWYYMDEPIEETGVNYTIRGNGNLIVSGLNEKGDLPFKCVVWNEAGEASSLYVVKAISAPATIGPNQVRQVNSSQGQPTIITCEIEIEWEKSEVVWKKNGELIKLGGVSF
uniref:Ig-like domain-containing protein n=1 Tax=Bursaphelenchus xylophilus TaxID=6326 RepID=A0A1I7SNA5_BURXY